MLALFETCVKSILCYGCEVWGSHKANDIEKVFMKFCKRLLGVKSNCNNAMVYIELGCLPLRSVRIIRIVKYWFKLLGTTNCILKSCHLNLTIDCTKAKRSCSNWAAFIRSELYSIGLIVNYRNTKNTLCSKNIFQS